MSVNSTSLSFSRKFDFTFFRPTRLSASFSMDNPTAPIVNAFSVVGAPDDELEASFTTKFGATDLLQWRKENPGSQIYGRTMTSDHHDELIKLGINPSLKKTQVTHKFPYAIFCAPPSRSLDYPGEVRSD